MIRAALLGLFWGCSVATAQSLPTTRPSLPRVPRAESFFGLHFDLHPNESDTALGADADEANIARLLDRVKPDYIQYDCKGHAGWLGYPSEVGPSAKGIVKDSLAIWRKATAGRGVALLIHFSGLWDSRAVHEHPEWAAVSADGKVSPNATSVFGPYVDQRMIPQLKEAITRYHLDGAWVDGECWAAQLDYSPAALAAWKKETTWTAAPHKRGEPHWQEWKDFHRRHLEQYVSHWIDAVHAACPWAQLTSNWMYTTFVPKPVVARVDFLSGDYDPNISVERARIEARYLASTGMPWDLMAWGFSYQVAGMGKNFKPAVHLEQEAAVVLMQGGGFQIYNQPTRSGHVTDSIIDTAGQVADFCRARQAVSHRSTSIPQVALIMSTAAIRERNDAVGSTGGTFNPLLGAMHAMLELHYSVDVLAEHQIKGRVKEYPLVVVPDFEVLPEETQNEILAHVENGGRLLVMGTTAPRHFAKALGVQFDGGPQQVDAELLSPSGLTNCDGMWQKVTPTGARPLGERFPTPDTRKNGAVAATIASYGRGRVAAIYGPVDTRFHQAHHPRLREFIGQVVREAWPDPSVTIDAPACVELALRRTRDGRTAVHLLNRANAPSSVTYGVIDYVPPIGPISVRVRCESKPQRVEWVPEGKALEWSWSDGTLAATIPRVEIHGALVVTP